MGDRNIGRQGVSTVDVVRALPLLIGLLLAALLPSPALAADATVDAGDFFYRADYVRIDPGDSVTWRFLQGQPHTATSRSSAPARFDSDVKDPGQTFTQAFTVPGRYEYFCTLHPSLMDGVVQVGPDTVRPRLTRVSARRRGRAVRISFRLSEEARARVVVRRGGRRVKTIRTSLRDKGAQSVRYSPRRPGRYTATVTAVDREGNSSSARRASFRVPRG